jgi:hypothetical protein
MIFLKKTKNCFRSSIFPSPEHPFTSVYYFEKLNANRCILNPEFLSVINPRTGPRQILFHANYVKVNLRESDAGISADFAQFICARRITLHTSLAPHRNNLLRYEHRKRTRKSSQLYFLAKTGRILRISCQDKL